MLRATISRPGKPDVQVEQPVTLAPGEEREVSFAPDRFRAADARPSRPVVAVHHGRSPTSTTCGWSSGSSASAVDETHQRFGIRTITQDRDDDEHFPELGKGGNFYLEVNGRDFLVRGATYTPDLLYAYDPDREDAILAYVRDLGLNMLRLESKIPGERFVETADELGIPLMVGWMCCNQWEKWPQWDDEDNRVAQGQPAVADRDAALARRRRSCGPTPATAGRRDRCARTTTRSFGTCTGRTPSSTPCRPTPPTPTGERCGTASRWRARTRGDRRRTGSAGATAPPGVRRPNRATTSTSRRSRACKKFIPPDKLWPINDYWYFHAGSNPGNAALTSIQRAINRRYGPSGSAEEFARKAQLAHYESTRAQFESFAALGWAGHKMTIYWMLNSHWPSFFGNIFDYYLRPGRRLLRRQEGAAATVGGVRLLRDGGPQPGRRSPSSTRRRTTPRTCGCGSGLRPRRASCATTETADDLDGARRVAPRTP